MYTILFIAAAAAARAHGPPACYHLNMDSSRYNWPALDATQQVATFTRARTRMDQEGQETSPAIRKDDSIRGVCLLIRQPLPGIERVGLQERALQLSRKILEIHGKQGFEQRLL